MTDPFQFTRPVTQLSPYLRECVQDLDKHGFCIVADQLIMDHRYDHAQLELFREACRIVSIEHDRNLIVNADIKQPDLVIGLADHAADPGSLPESYEE